ncbi:hypothetical protein RC1_2404 [Rhodospirillum centenum SW]|uniref:Uncharacterized protein n=1 Tax=Rhodospirillum centenum (strain ATCC 51521 / SW) TaxID=414684 RepID=B6IUG4_RHOCS|nr:hypothetical protein RC1_2404 [Rhodospirillum centenum SW]
MGGPSWTAMRRSPLGPGNTDGTDAGCAGARICTDKQISSIRVHPWKSVFIRVPEIPAVGDPSWTAMRRGPLGPGNTDGTDAGCAGARICTDKGRTPVRVHPWKSVSIRVPEIPAVGDPSWTAMRRGPLVPGNTDGTDAGCAGARMARIRGYPLSVFIRGNPCSSAFLKYRPWAVHPGQRCAAVPWGQETRMARMPAAPAHGGRG